MAELEVQKTLQGSLVYQLWCSGATSEDVGELVMTLNVTPGAIRASRQAVDDGMYVAVVINTEYDIEAVIGRITRVALGWAKNHTVTMIDGAGKPM